jgi:hypothetical protein
MGKVRRVLLEIVKILIVAFIVWLSVGSVYAMGSTDVVTSPMYNDLQTEARVVFLYIPIMSLIIAFLYRALMGFPVEVFGRYVALVDDLFK